MHQKFIQLEFAVFDILSELSDADLAMVQAANAATQSAYAPYSGFFVGAALLLNDGQVLSGSNQENAAYPSGLCAERTALFAAGHSHPQGIVQAIAIAARSQRHDVQQPVVPCGACLQVMAETERRQSSPIRILLCGQQGKTIVCEGLKTLMPLQFSLLP